jgi:hypothetical protein
MGIIFVESIGFEKPEIQNFGRVSAEPIKIFT